MDNFNGVVVPKLNVNESSFSMLRKLQKLECKLIGYSNSCYDINCEDCIYDSEHFKEYVEFKIWSE